MQPPHPLILANTVNQHTPSEMSPTTAKKISIKGADSAACPVVPTRKTIKPRKPIYHTCLHCEQLKFGLIFIIKVKSSFVLSLFYFYRVGSDSPTKWILSTMIDPDPACVLHRNRI